MSSLDMNAPITFICTAAENYFYTFFSLKSLMLLFTTVNVLDFAHENNINVLNFRYYKLVVKMKNNIHFTSKLFDILI